MSAEQIILPSGGCLPGLPGEHAPGIYTVDYEVRTIQPYVAPDPTAPSAQPSAAPAPIEQPAQPV